MICQVGSVVPMSSPKMIELLLLVTTSEAFFFVS